MREKTPYIFYFKVQTHAAVGVTEDEQLEGELLWFPKSQIEISPFQIEPEMDDLEVGDELEILVPDWLAQAKGLE